MARKLGIGLTVVAAAGVMWYGISAVLDSSAPGHADHVNKSQTDGNGNRPVAVAKKNSRTKPEIQPNSPRPNPRPSTASGSGTSATQDESPAATVKASPPAQPHNKPVAVVQPGNPTAAAVKNPMTPAGTAAPATTGKTIERVKIFRLVKELTVNVGFSPSVIEIVKVETGKTRQRDWMSIIGTNVKSHWINQPNATGTALFKVECKGNELTVLAAKGAPLRDADQPLLVFAVVCRGVQGGGWYARLSCSRQGTRRRRLFIS